MATGGGEVPGRKPDDRGSDSADLDTMKCQPCLEAGDRHDVAGMCVDCDEYLCAACFKTHRLPKPWRYHQLIDREQMLQGNLRASITDTCSELCSDHEGDFIKYYCQDHHLLGCTVCITMDHKACESVQYIPHAAKNLESDDVYTQTESEIKKAFDKFQTLSQNVDQNSAQLESSCLEAIESVREFRKKVDVATGKIEADLIDKLQKIKSNELNELATIGKKLKAILEDLHSSMAKIEELRKVMNNCNAYMETMRTKKMLEAAQSQIKEVEISKTNLKRNIQFSPNLGMLDTLNQSVAFGFVSGSRGEIVGAKHSHDINVKTATDTSTCGIRGITFLPDDRLVLTDYYNANIKVVSVQRDNVVLPLKLSSYPWDITAIRSNKVAVTMPAERSIAIVEVGDTAIDIDYILDVKGSCYGIDYRKDKLAVSFRKPHKVQVLSMSGTVLHEIESSIFYNPYYLTYGKDDTLYVSNYSGNNVVCVKLDGTVVATYTHNELSGPNQPVVDSKGKLIVCAYSSHTIHHVHVTNQDQNSMKTILSRDDGLSNPYAMCLCEKKDMLYVGMHCTDFVKVYNLHRDMESSV